MNRGILEHAKVENNVFSSFGLCACWQWFCIQTSINCWQFFL